MAAMGRMEQPVRQAQKVHAGAILHRWVPAAINGNDMALRLITPPASEPISLTLAKSHLRVDHTDDDTLITAQIAGARFFAEKFTARAFITQTWELVIDQFPTNEIKIPLPPLQTVNHIKYDDAGGVEQTVNTGNYFVDSVS